MTEVITPVVDEIAKLISDTNQPGRWGACAKWEKDRRRNEAKAIIKFLNDRYDMDICDP